MEAMASFKRRGNNAQLNTGTFQIVVPKADRGGSGRQVAKFVAPKADRGNSSGPKTLFSISPKAPRADSGSTIGAEGSARRWTSRCHGRAAEVCRPATARASFCHKCLPRSSRRFLLRLPLRPRLLQSWRLARLLPLLRL